MMEFIANDGLESSYAIDEAKRNLEALNPRLGACLVLIGGDDETTIEGIPDNLTVVPVGFDQSRLQLVVEKLALEA